MGVKKHLLALRILCGDPAPQVENRGRIMIPERVQATLAHQTAGLAPNTVMRLQDAMGNAEQSWHPAPTSPSAPPRLFVHFAVDSVGSGRFN